VARTGHGRSINRHDYDLDEVRATLARPVVDRILKLVRLRNDHPAFEGDLRVAVEEDRCLALEWQSDGATAGLKVDFRGGRASIVIDGREDPIAHWTA
jgi:sucrose phosphorylase